VDVTPLARVYNFRPGPSMLPVPVLEEVGQHLLAFPNIGMSSLEIHHRSQAFGEILAGAEADIRRLAKIPANYRVLFVGGGTSLQFSTVPMNLLAQGMTADYIDTGVWAQYAIKEARKVGTINIAASLEAEAFTRVPRQDELKLTPSAAYVHMTSNNTDVGTQWKTLPDVGESPLISDATSDMFCRPIDISRHALIYAGAQKNLGCAGVTLIIIRDDLLRRSPASLPTMLNYSVHAEHRSLFNTPPVFAVYVMRLVMKWLLERGGLEGIAQVNHRKAEALYAEVDRTGFYRGLAQPDSRSLMNVTFRLRDETLETSFIENARSAALDGLEGHPTIGGMRASIYNAFPEEGVAALVQFMREFERTHG
jgi:phosphoserine aminotransferase